MLPGAQVEYPDGSHVHNNISYLASVLKQNTLIERVEMSKQTPCLSEPFEFNEQRLDCLRVRRTPDWRVNR